MPGLYPPIEPHARGCLDVGQGHRIAWEECGNPEGRPALVLHGGPGSGRSATARRLFDPQGYRIILFDQRGCGESRPHAAEPVPDLDAVTMPHHLADIETLRRHLSVERWLVLGGSWGATLALASAQAHPERVTALVLTAVATTTRREIAWITGGISAFLPEAFARFRAGVPAAERADLVAAYRRLLLDPDPAVRERAARAWCDWEIAVVALHAHEPDPRYDDPRFRLAFARLVTHTWHHAGWLEEDQLLRAMHRLKGIPGTLIHGRLDLGSPLATAWHLHRAWPGSDLVVVGGAGHDGRDPGMRESIVAATDGHR